ncbi:hypothetical protein KY290_011491 [Solanum tuberosum]|uniref:Uncharacterized protein n=1 Tax=Solanum tuberosum TaxID=4113 RepID=A0ABQ7W0S8_SOLTU|nr:hypothetical protein KY284_011597 [Solanum tuberosum]KAH0774354.1 hypothetical protein KY290_011491 [Solanum tuberosum]
MANSLCFTPLASLNTFNKPGLINGNGNCAGRKIQLIKDVTFNSKSNLRVVEVKAADSDKETKVRSIVCQKCEGNGAVACSQCKGVGVNSVDHFNGRFKAGGLCWLCRGKKDILCGDCNGAGFLGGFMIESIEAMLHPALSRLSPMMPRIAQGLHYENKHIERLFVQKNVKSAMGESKCRKTLYLELKHPPNIKFKFFNNILDVISHVQSKEGDNLNTTDMAYASVASLVNTIQLLLTSDSQMRSQICDHGEEFHTIREKVSSLEVFLKKFEKSNDSREMTDLEAQIKEAADGVEITIQLRLTDIIMAKNEMQKKKARERLCDSLKQVAEEIDRVQKESTKIQYKAKQSSEEYLVQTSSSAKVILNGIGKTTLAKEVSNDAFIRSHFDVRAWATISQEHNVKDILVSLLHSTKEKDDTVNTEDESKLADRGIRNVRKLKVEGDNNDYEGFQESRLFDNLVHLQHLETLSVTISADLQDSVPVTIPKAKAFPATLKKLKLYGTGLRWDNLIIVGELPNLEVLKLIFDAVGEEWYPISGGFSRSKILLLKNSDLKYWNTTNDSFPVLEHLMIIDCTKLEEIPIEFADTSSLKLIELKDCKPHLEDSATRIQQEQEDIGNNPVDVRISSKVREWRLSQTDIS